MRRTNHTSLDSLGFGYQPSLDVATGPPFIQVNGYTTIGDPITGPRNTYENAFDYSGSLSWVHGRHELKFGGGYQHLQVNVLQGIATNGFFVFAAVPGRSGCICQLSVWPASLLSAGPGRFFPRHSRQFAERLCAGHLQGDVSADFESRAALRTAVPVHRDPQPADAMDSGPAVHRDAQRAARICCIPETRAFRQG